MIQPVERTVRGVRSLQTGRHRLQEPPWEELAFVRRIREVRVRSTWHQLAIDYREVSFHPVIRHRG
jgi:hypothetical protein